MDPRARCRPGAGSVQLHDGGPVLAERLMALGRPALSLGARVRAGEPRVLEVARDRRRVADPLPAPGAPRRRSPDQLGRSDLRSGSGSAIPRHAPAAVCAPRLGARPRCRPRPRPWLPIVFLIWANLHASFVLGLLTLPLLLFPSVRRREHRVRVLILAAGCLGATLINPHGVAAVMRAIEHALDPTSPIHQ